MSHSLFRAPTPAERELLALRSRLRALRRILNARELELADLRAHLLSFEGRYIRQVGLLYKQLDEWEKKRAALHTPPGSAEDEDFSGLPAPEPAPPQPQDLRALFRELAKRIHPDHATSPADEQRRTRLMAQANDALQRRDRRMLQRLLNGFDAPAASIEDDLDAARELLHQVREDIAHASDEHRTLASSELAQLEAEAMRASRQGRDLLAEMAARVHGRIGIAMRAYELDLDRIKRPPKGLNVEDLLSAETRPRPQPQLRYDPKARRWVRK